MLHPEINWNICQSCTPCLARRACKSHAFYQPDPGETPYIEYGYCTYCGQCVLACVFDAVAMVNHKVPSAFNGMH